MEKFGYPGTLISEYEHWAVQLRPQQATLGALVLCCKDAASRYSDLEQDAFSEFAVVVKDVEAALAATFAYDKINYLMLMMVDPDVHYHVLPRYAAAPEFGGSAFEDPGWPGPPRLDHATETDAVANDSIIEAIKKNWPSR